MNEATSYHTLLFVGCSYEPSNNKVSREVLVVGLPGWNAEDQRVRRAPSEYEDSRSAERLGRFRV